MATSLSVWEDVAPLSSRSLSNEHRNILEVKSKIAPEIIEARGYYSLTKPQIVELVHQEIISPAALRAEGWMGIPVIRPDGEKHGEVIRLFGSTPKFKYLWPTGLRLCADVHPASLPYLRDTSVPLLITEGIKKGDAILSAAMLADFPLVVLSVNGCYGWKVKTEDGASIASPDFLDLALEGRHVYVNSDSDYRTNNRVSAGWNECAAYFSSKTGEHRTVLVVTPPSGTEKQGADDFLASGRDLRDLLEHAQSPERAVADQAGGYSPIVIRSGKRLIEEAGDTIPHLISPLIPERSITLVAGHSGTYKTWHLVALALDGAFGLPWLGHPQLVNEHGPFTTLYVNKEMSGVILGNRLKTLALNERYRKFPDCDEVLDTRLIFTEDAELDLHQEEQRDRLEDTILSCGALAVVLDSLSMSWHGDENSASEVGELYAHLRGIIARTSASFVLAHHLLKPSGGKPSKTPMVSQFAIRGSGQLYQQADACIMMDLFTTPTQAEDEKLVAMYHVKARTSLEMPAWVSRFSSNDGLFQSVEYLCRLAEAKAQVYVESGGDVNKLQEWIIEACLGMPAMLPGPGNPGFRSKQLFLMLQQAWTIPDKPAPSDSTLHRQMKDLVDSGKIIMVEENRRLGNLYQLANLEEPEPIVEVAPPDPTVVT